MRFCILSLIVALCASCQHARIQSRSQQPASAEDAELVTLSLPDFEGVLYFFQTTRGSLRATPKWKSDAEFPPLSPRRAEEVALQRAQQMRPDVLKWHRENISLQESDHDAWFYLVRFWRGDRAITGLPHFLDVPVLMDGRALPATTKPGKK